VIHHNTTLLENPVTNASHGSLNRVAAIVIFPILRRRFFFRLDDLDDAGVCVYRKGGSEKKGGIESNGNSCQSEWGI
jgi:hypothetical protein